MSAQEGKSDLALVFDIETDPKVFPPDRLRRVGRLGLLIGAPALVLGFGATFVLVVIFHRINKLTGLPVFFGGLMMATGVYRFGLGLVPVLVRSSVLRLHFLFLILSALLAATFLAYFWLFSGD